MEYREELWWILDQEHKSYQENIDFVHSLGLKCDCVGWCKMKLSSPETENVLREIDRFCKEEGWSARAMYFREYTGFDSDWYELETKKLKQSNWDCGCITAEAEDGETAWLLKIRACNETDAGPKNFREHILVPERFKKVCQRHNIPGLRFCWAQDKGKYEAEQYYHIYVERQIEHIAVAKEIDRLRTDIKTGKSRELIETVGGYLPEICDVFHDMQMIILQDCYLAADMPEGGIACAYIPMRYDFHVRHKLLIHKDVAELLVREKAINPSALKPAPVFKSLPQGYELYETSVLPCPRADFAEKMDEACEKLRDAARPVRAISEKEALKALRSAKRERKQDFAKRLPKAALEAMEGTGYAALRPYLQVADGGLLSEEYRLFSYEQAQMETEAFLEAIAREELLDKIPCGIAVAGCADGDRVILSPEGKLLRFSHEVPEEIEQWQSLALFIYEAIREND